MFIKGMEVYKSDRLSIKINSICQNIDPILNQSSSAVFCVLPSTSIFLILFINIRACFFFKRLQLQHNSDAHAEFTLSLILFVPPSLPSPFLSLILHFPLSNSISLPLSLHFSLTHSPLSLPYPLPISFFHPDTHVTVGSLTYP